MNAPKKASAKPVAATSPARKAAFAILLAVENGSAHSDELLRASSVSQLSSADRNLATTLVLGVLRWQIRLDRQINALLRRPKARLDPEILIALRLGAFQLLHLDRIPARAAIDESVELAKQAGHRFASGMVNAVLRKLAQPSQSATEDPVLQGHDLSRAADASQSTQALAPEGSLSGDCESHPVWMVERWVNFYGLETAKTICQHGQSQPVLTVRLASPEVEAELTASGIALSPGELLSAARTVLSGDITATPAFREGRVRIQDEGSQLVAELAAICNQNPGSGPMRILDACAAPGGKTLILAERLPAAHIVACEQSPRRLEELRKRLAPLGSRIEFRLADAASLSELAAYDLALADVPCSGTGTLGRNPEIRHRLRPEDLLRQAQRQRAILSAALGTLRPGGRVVYSTCSLEPEENEEVVAAVIAASPNARVLSLEDSVGRLFRQGILTEAGATHLRRCITAEGYLRLLPGAVHTDGFFIALIEQVGNN